MDPQPTTEVAIRARIARLVGSGELTCDEPDQTWAGEGLGKRCAACLEPIRPPQIEFEVDLPGGRTYVLHQRCHEMWLEVCAEEAKPS